MYQKKGIFTMSYPEIASVGYTKNDEQFEKNKALFKAIDANDVDGTRLAIESGANVRASAQIRDVHMSYTYIEANGACLFDLCALHFAAGKGNTEIMQLLLDKGASVDGRAEYYNPTALEYIAGRYSEKDDLPVMQFLIDHGADVNAQGHRAGYTPLLQATRGSVDKVQFLLKNGADPHKTGTDAGISPLAKATIELVEGSRHFGSKEQRKLFRTLAVAAKGDFSDKSGSTTVYDRVKWNLDRYSNDQMARFALGIFNYEIEKNASAKKEESSIVSPVVQRNFSQGR